MGEDKGVLQNTIDPRDNTRSVYAWYQGTSMAAPHVAAVAALLFAAGADSPDEVEGAMVKGVTAVGDGSRTDEYGAGIVDAQGALAALGKTGGTGTVWGPFFWAMGLLAATLLTLTAKTRPGYLNVFFTPGFLLAMLVSTVGAFFLQWLGSGPGDTMSALSMPLPDWQRWLFGRGRLASPLFYSALIPLIASIFAVPQKSLRRVIAGLSLGFAGFLAYAGWAKAPALAYLPFTFMARPWLVVNAVVCVLLARALLRRDKA